MAYREIGRVDKRESEWPTLVIALILIVIGVALFG